VGKKVNEKGRSPEESAAPNNTQEEDVLLIPMLPELPEEVKEMMWTAASLLQLVYLVILAVATGLGSLIAVSWGADFLRTGQFGSLAAFAVFAIGIGFAARAFADEVIEGTDGA
jgi:hypothetical protein